MDAAGARILAGTSSSCSGVPVFGRCCGDAWLVTVQTDAGGARSEGGSASVGRTTHHTSSYIGSWASPGEFRALSGSSKTSVGDVPDRSRVRPVFSDHFRCARCHSSPPTGAGHVLKVSRTQPFPALQKVWGRGWRAPVDIEETPVGYGIVQALDLRRGTSPPGHGVDHPGGRAAPGPCWVTPARAGRDRPEGMVWRATHKESRLIDPRHLFNTLGHGGRNTPAPPRHRQEPEVLGSTGALLHDFHRFVGLSGTPDHAQKVLKSVGKRCVHQLVADLAPFGAGSHQPAVT